MKKNIALKIGFCFLLPIFVRAQSLTDTSFITTDSLENVTVRAFELNRNLQQIPAAVSIINTAQLQRFNNSSLLPALSIQPGVKMEERSPGSYRLNIRGSSLRAPFGVRNVKIYVNDMIFTDPGGGTYLNQLGFYNVSSIEVLKGPPASLYGAGTGGAMLLQTEPKQWQAGVDADYGFGSYGLQQVHAKVSLGTAANQNVFTYQHQNADGFRAQSKMRRDVATYESAMRFSDKQKLSTLFMYSDLMYETPGGLTLAQYKVEPRAARPAAGTQPSAQAAKAAIYQKTFYAGVANEYSLASAWKNTTSVYGAFTWFNNPGIRVYEKRTEPHFGGRSVFTNNFILGEHKLQLVYGGEAQKGVFTVRTYKNKNGQVDTLQTDDEINNWRYSLFGQADIDLKSGWIISAGASFNKSYVGITRLNSYPVTPQQRSFGDIISPRISLLKYFKSLSFYGLISQGFSPPTTSELVPGNGSINNTLEAEKGWNYELGSRGHFMQEKLHYDVNIYWFQLQDAISQRRDINGNDFFVNTGGTKQNGLEAQLRYDVQRKKTNGFVKEMNITAGYTYQDFTYKNYKVIEASFDGKELPGVAKHFGSLALDLSVPHNLYVNVTYTYTHKIWMNDANTDYAPSYNLFGMRLGWKHLIKKSIQLEAFVGADNLGDTHYSLGNDINAAAGRYYNAASGRNYYAGLAWKWLKKV